MDENVDVVKVENESFGNEDLDDNDGSYNQDNFQENNCVINEVQDKDWKYHKMLKIPFSIVSHCYGGNSITKSTLLCIMLNAEVFIYYQESYHVIVAIKVSTYIA